MIWTIIIIIIIIKCNLRFIRIMLLAKSFNHLFLSLISRHVPFFFSDSVHKVPKWNFWKFLINPEGKVVRFWRTDEPLESIRQEVTALVREIIVKKRVEL